MRAPTADDAGAVAELIAACQLADGGRTEMTVEELVGDWQESEPSEEAVVVTAPDGRMAAYAGVLNRSYVSVSVHGYVTPEYRGRGVGSYLVCCGEEWTRERMDRAPEGTRVAVQHYVNTLNKPARRLLETSGYAAVRGYYRMSIELEQALLPPEWPVGIGRGALLLAGAGRARRLRGGGGRRWLRVGPSPRHLRPFLGVHSPGGLRLQSLVSRGERQWDHWRLPLQDRGRQGEVDVVAERHPWRGRGLGLALLRHAFGEFYRRGVREVGLSVDAESTTGAPRLYRRAGMRVAGRYMLYQRELRPGRNASEVPSNAPSDLQA